MANHYGQNALAELDRLEQEINRATMMQGSGAEILALSRAVVALARAVEAHPTPSIAVWPADGGLGYLTANNAGRGNVFDLAEGRFYPADYPDSPFEQMSGQLRGGARSAHFHPEAGSAFSLEVIAPGGARPVLPFFANVQHHYLTHVHMEKLIVYTTLPIGAFVEFSEAEEPPVPPIGIQGPQRYSGDDATTDAMTATVLRPVGVNPKAGTTSTLSVARAQSGSPTLSAQVINTLFNRTMLWLVRNTSTTDDMFVNIQGAMRGVEADFTDDRATGQSYFVGAGQNAELEIKRHYLFQRIRTRSTVTGRSATNLIVVHGLTG